jgi:hypothetical protein
VLGAGIDAFLDIAIESNTSVKSVHGSVFNMIKKSIEVVEGTIEVEMPSNE